MKIDLSGRRAYKVSEMLRGYTMEKMGKLEKFSLKIESARIIYASEKINQTCEIVLLGKNLRLSAQETTTNMQASLDAAVHKLQIQLERYHDRLKHRRRKDSPRGRSQDEVEPEEA